jgi:hypothetical protein
MAHADASAAMMLAGGCRANASRRTRLEGTSQIDPVEAEADFDHRLHGGWSMDYHAWSGEASTSTTRVISMSANAHVVSYRCLQQPQ